MKIETKYTNGDHVYFVEARLNAPCGPMRVVGLHINITSFSDKGNAFDPQITYDLASIDVKNGSKSLLSLPQDQLFETYNDALGLVRGPIMDDMLGNRRIS